MKNRFNLNTKYIKNCILRLFCLQIDPEKSLFFKETLARRLELFFYKFYNKTLNKEQLKNQPKKGGFLA